MSDPLPKSMQPTADAVARLHGLLQDPQPGLMSWLSMAIQASRDLYKVLDEGGAGKFE